MIFFHTLVHSSHLTGKGKSEITQQNIRLKLDPRKIYMPDTVAKGTFFSFLFRGPGILKL